MRKRIFLAATSFAMSLSLNAMATTSTTTTSTSATPSPTTTPVSQNDNKASASPVAGGLSGTFDFTSNYLFRGTSSSHNLPAAQGGLTYLFTNGLYFKLWGSNVDFKDPQGNTATVEFDTIIGVTNPIGEHFTYNVLVDRYNYPKAASSYSELIANIQWYFLTAMATYSSNVQNVHHSGTYYNLGFQYDIPQRYFFNVEKVGVSGGVGHYSFQRAGGLSSYNDYNLKLSKAIGNYVLSVQWSTTSGSGFNLPNDPVSGDYGPHIIWTTLVNF